MSWMKKGKTRAMKNLLYCLFIMIFISIGFTAQATAQINMGSTESSPQAAPVKDVLSVENQRNLLMDSLLKSEKPALDKIKTRSISPFRQQSTSEAAAITEQPVIDLPESLIEKMYKGDLRQFGYDMFSRANFYATSISLTSKYTLNIGDRLKIYMWGDAVDYMGFVGGESLQPVVDTVVDREGNVFVPGAGAIPAEGKSIEEIQKVLYSKLALKYTNFQVKVTVSQPRDYPIHVMGNVKNPGTIYISASSSILDALNYAGGVDKSGSLRDVVYINTSSGATTKIDLYDLLVHGKFPRINLKSGDVLLVKPIGKVAAISDGVKRPAIYEYVEGETLQDIVSYAGGLMPSTNMDNLIVARYNQKLKEKEVEELNYSELKHIKPVDGDLLSFKGLFDDAENKVVLEGHVKHPGEFQYVSGMKLSDVIKSKDDLLKKTFTDQAIIERVIGTDKDVIVIPVSLNDFFAGRVDPAIQAQDVIRIYSSTEMPTIEIAGEVINPGLIPYKSDMTIKDILGNVELSMNANDLVLEISNNIYEKVKDTFNQEQLMFREIDKTSVLPENLTLEYDSESQKTYLESKVTSVYLYDLLTKDKETLNQKLLPYDKLLIRKVRKEEAIRTVSVIGYVNNPGVFRVEPGMKLTDLIKRAGGVNHKGYLKGLIFLRPSVGEKQQETLQRTILELQEEISSVVVNLQKYAGDLEAKSVGDFIVTQQDLLRIMQEKAKYKYGRVVLDIEGDSIADLGEFDDMELLDGDEIYIPPMPNYIMVMGEVYNQTAIAYYPERSAQFYIDKVGGLTKRAKKKEIYIMKVNGSVIKPKSLDKMALEPGDSVIVPRKVKIPLNIRGIIKDVAQIGASAAQTVFILTKL